MKLDKYSNPIFDSSDLFKLFYQGYQIPNDLFVEKDQEIINLEQILDKKFQDLDQSLDISEFDSRLQNEWFVPDEYKELDIEKYVTNLCPPWDPEATRVEEELAEFRNRNMLDLLRWLKYFVDTARANNVVWGVGRGSSVASYVLYLLGVHKIDSIKYNLDWRDFLR